MKSILKDKRKYTTIESIDALLAEELSKNYISICKVDLHTGKTTILKSERDLEFVGCTVSWSKAIKRYIRRRVYPEDRHILTALTQDRLKKLLTQESESLSIEIRCVNEDNTYDWVEVQASIISMTEKTLLVTTRNINNDRMLKSIVNLFVYESLDYLILLDAKHNTYRMFSGKNTNTVLPPIGGDDYTKEVLLYNKKYVLPEDFKRVTSNMQIPHVLEMLEKNDKYSFQSNGIKKNGGYRRTQVQFQYYDKAAKLILLTRMDITEAFKDEQARSETLSKALKEAQLDPLTQIYNKKATQELVSYMLERQCRNSAAMMFIDVDQFKIVNDTLGHLTGDTVLQYLATALKEIADRSGIAGRIGGDEFLLFLPNLSDKIEIKHYATQVCRIFDTFHDEMLKNLSLSCSVGISMYPKDGTNYDTLIRKADWALYISKQNGKNQYYFYSE
ncbi:MAG: GGDEF domain-containing protein [Eubacterium sp.]